MAKRTTIVTLPDGSVAMRTSQTKVYGWAVMATVDNRARAQRLRREADELAEAHRRVREIIASGDLSVLAREHSSTSGRGERFYSSRVPGTRAHYWLPDWKRPESWAEYADNAVASILTDSEKRRAEADELDAGPAVSYGVWRWSERRDSAEKALGAFADHPETVCTVVPCQES